MQHFRGCQRRLFVGKWSGSGRLGADSDVGGDPCVPNGKSPKLGPCSLAGGLPVRPLAIRCGVCAGHLPFDTPRGQGAPSTTRCIKTSALSSARRSPCQVREHPAPPGALRHSSYSFAEWVDGVVREHPAPPGALRPGRRAPVARSCRPGQGAPSTTRCIKTRTSCRQQIRRWSVREHPAPPGALRRVHRVVDVREQGEVREHPAPPGALRQHQ